MWRLTLAIALILGARAACGDEPSSVPPPLYRLPAPEFGQDVVAPGQPPATMPDQFATGPWEPVPLTRTPRRNDPAGRQDWPAPAVIPAPATTVVTVPAAVEKPTDSTWYFRQDAFYWNERIGSTDFVNEYGPLSTLGYVRHVGIERFRIELFGGTVAYDGFAQFDDGTMEPYHQSFGTSYLGCRGEYDLLIEPASWTRLRAIIGVGTRFWIRDLKNASLPDGDVAGYQETWWTFYPYVGLETKDSPEPGPKFFGSVRFWRHAPDLPVCHLLRHRRLSELWRHRPDGVGGAIPEVLGLGLPRSHDVGKIERRHRRLRRLVVPTRLAHAHHRRQAGLHLLTPNPAHVLRPHMKARPAGLEPATCGLEIRCSIP